jgi:hypothetical protein
MLLIVACKYSVFSPEKEGMFYTFGKVFVNVRVLHLYKCTYPARKFADICVRMNLKLLSLYLTLVSFT